MTGVVILFADQVSQSLNRLVVFGRLLLPQDVLGHLRQNRFETLRQAKTGFDCPAQCLLDHDSRIGKIKLQKPYTEPAVVRCHLFTLERVEHFFRSENLLPKLFVKDASVSHLLESCSQLLLLDSGLF